MVERFHQALVRAGGRSELRVVVGGVHGFDLRPEAWRWSFEEMASFLDSEM
jgi:acetyl esterase/lipase